LFQVVWKPFGTPVFHVQEDQFPHKREPLCLGHFRKKRQNLRRLPVVPGGLEFLANLFEPNLGFQRQNVVGNRGRRAHVGISFSQISGIRPSLRLTDRVEQLSDRAISSTLVPSILHTATERSAGSGNRFSRRW